MSRSSLSVGRVPREGSKRGRDNDLGSNFIHADIRTNGGEAKQIRRQDSSLGICMGGAKE